MTWSGFSRNEWKLLDIAIRIIKDARDNEIYKAQHLQHIEAIVLCKYVNVSRLKGIDGDEELIALLRRYFKHEATINILKSHGWNYVEEPLFGKSYIILYQLEGAEEKAMGIEPPVEKIEPNVKNQVILGDNLKVLKSIESNSIDLIYLDPPFNTGKVWSADGGEFNDKFTDRKEYLKFMGIRLWELKRVLKKTGSIYLHCDPSISHYLKIKMDDIFGEDNFKNEIIWNYYKWANILKYFQRNHDTILFYKKSDAAVFNDIEIEPSLSKQENLKIGYKMTTVKDKGGRIKQLLIYDEEKVEQLVKEGKLDLNKYDKTVIVKSDRNKVSDCWSDIKMLNSQAKERTGYPTQKPIALLERIIRASSNEGDIVLDPFCGSGTTLVASKILNRHYIGIDESTDAVRIAKERINNITSALLDE